MRRIRYSLELGSHLRSIRKEARLTQTQVAERSGVNFETNICGYEHNRRMPDISTVILILRACGKQLAIVDLEEECPTPPLAG